MPKLTHADRKLRRQQMVEQVLSGKWPREVAKQFRVTVGTVRLACDAAGIAYKRVNQGRPKAANQRPGK